MIPKSQFFINRNALIEIKDAAEIHRSHTSLARSLMIEMYTDEALQSCSIAGYAAGCKNTYRPGLHKGAMKAILCMRNRFFFNYGFSFYFNDYILFYYFFSAFVRQFAAAKQWVKKDDQIILSSLRNKLTEIRPQTQE